MLLALSLIRVAGKFDSMAEGRTRSQCIKCYGCASFNNQNYNWY